MRRFEISPHRNGNADTQNIFAEGPVQPGLHIDRIACAPEAVAVSPQMVVGMPSNASSDAYGQSMGRPDERMKLRHAPRYWSETELTTVLVGEGLSVPFSFLGFIM